ncbi:putative mediator of RNA polymerase II transcription subunit 12 isoform X2 [Hyposmocoma kahamanoa]|uniref:putative mediator of RNA polymerase II transcription subunit 12 isoform X2 n=1 Tax=Hyposmocoma kahamanoa TaxID=1477025 RepID=UPI000E6D78A1|nr:putative mediator of RNA polymerase II transcription subunit 12 isoform X2 [Hyposmocoma kahamanoa]
MNTKVFLILAVSLCACAAEVKEKEKEAEPEQSKEKRQAQDGFVPSHFVYRPTRKQEQVAPVEEPQEDDKDSVSRVDNEEYRPGQVFSLNPQELLELQPERKAPLPSTSQLQQLYSNPQPDSRQNVQQIYFLEPHGARQVSLQPSHAVIARPHYSSNGGEASVGAALSVSDTGVGASDSFDQELLALLGQAPVRQQVAPQLYQQQVQASTQSVAPQYQQISVQSVAPQYQQVDRYITKPNKKPSKHRPKVHSVVSPPQSLAAPQQYLIETTNVQQQVPQQPQQVPQYRPAPQSQPRPTQALRYVQMPTAQAFLQQALYERPEAQGLKVVAAPNLHQARPALAYRIIPQYQQQEAAPKQYRIVEAPRPQAAQQQRIPASSIERPVTFLKRFPEPEKMRAVKIYDPVPQEALVPQQPTQLIGEQYYLRPLYRSNEQRGRYELTPLGIRTAEQPRAVESAKSPHSSIYVNQKVAPKKVIRPQPARLEQAVKIDKSREQSGKADQPSSVEQINIEQHGQSLDEQRSQLPPPKNNRAYTPEEFAALVAAGYAVTPIPVAPLGAVAQSRTSVEPAPAPPQRRPLYSRRNPYLPLRGDDAP